MHNKKYYWEGINENGIKIYGVQRVNNLQDLINDLIKRDIFVLKIKKTMVCGSLFTSSKVDTKNIVSFCRQLCTLITSGVPILYAFNIIAHSSEDQVLQKLIKKIQMEIEGGNTLTIAFKNKSHHFDELFCSLINVGEESGSLDVILNYIANYKEKNYDLRCKFKKALFYPMVVFLISLVVTIILLVFVIPQFQNLYESFGSSLPLYTQVIISLSKAIKNYGLFFIGLIIISLIFGHFCYRNYPRVNLIFDSVVLKIPFLGSLIRKIILARFARMLAITCASGLSLHKSLKCMKNIVNNKIYKEAIVQVRYYVMDGQSIASALNNVSYTQSNFKEGERYNVLFPKRMIQMITIGEETGSLESMLIKIAEYYEYEVNYLVDNLSNLLEPIIMSTLGVLIGGLLIGMYLPIFKLGTII